MMLRKKIMSFLGIIFLLIPVQTFAAERPQASVKPEILSIQQCLDLAILNNQQIQEAEKKVVIARGAVREAQAAFWPDVNYQGVREQSDIAQYQVGPRYEKTDFKAGVSASMPLYTGGILQNNLKLTEIGLETAKESLRKAKQLLVFEIKEAYYNIWLTEQILQVQKSSFNNLDHHYQQVQSRYKAEMASKLEVLRAEVQRDSLKPKVINAENQVVLAKLELANLIDYPRNKEYEVKCDADQLPIPKSVTLTLEQVLNQAYQNRPEYHQIQLQAENRQVLTSMEKASYKPNVSVGAGYGVKNKDIGSGEWNDAWSLTFSIGGKIYDREIQAKIDQAKGQEDVSAIQKVNLRDQIRLDAEQSLQNLEVSLENIRVNQATIGLAKESLGITQLRVDNGMATTMDLMDDQLALDQALNGYYQGLVSYLIAEAKLDMVVGKD